MRIQRTPGIKKKIWFVGLLIFAVLSFGAFGGFSVTQSAYAEPENGATEQNTTTTDGAANQNKKANQNDNAGQNNESTDAEDGQESEGGGCKQMLGALGGIVCPVLNTIGRGVDWTLGKIESILQINPVAGAMNWLEGVLQIDPTSVQGDSAIHKVWEYVRNVTNIVFIGFFLVVIYSQITGYGISNYGIKKSLPKMILVAILINLSYLICVVAIDVSNVLGNGLRGVFSSIQEAVLSSNEIPVNEGVTMGEIVKAVVLGGGLAVGGVTIAIEYGLIFMVIPTLLGGLVSVVAGFVTITLRQAVVALLVMISPLAFVAYMLPNTEDWFKRWKKLFTQMLTFYPAFSLLFGASNLASFAIMSTGVANKDAFWIVLALAVRVFPLLYSVKLMKLSGTFLEGINAKLQGLAATPLATNRAWADSHRQLAAQRRLASGITPSARLLQSLSDRKISREESIEGLANYSKLRGQSYAARRKYRRGIPTRELEAEYKRQAKGFEYQEDINRHKNNMDKGLGDLEVVKANAGGLKKARLQKLDIANVLASDRLKLEAARGEKIEYENAKGFHERMENAINVHFDDKNRWNEDYKMHDIKDRDFARDQYNAIREVMEGDAWGIHYATASAAQGYDTQKKIIEAKMQKYFELTPPTKDVEYRLSELTRLSQDELAKGKKAASNIDAILPGLRILNQRGDTDIVQKQMENILNKNIGGGIELGTHASQALASFLMFDVKDNDPFLRRFGKYINLETARAYNTNDRKVLDVTYDEYVKGYHDGEPDTEKYPGGRMYAKKGMRQLTEGTSLDNIERTALSNLDESLKRAYGFDDNDKDKKWDVEGYLKKREEIQTAFEPAFLSASLKWLSGSEQINSAVKFWTGYELKQKKDKDGKMVVDEDGNPEYELSAIWDDPKGGFKGHEKELREYYRRKTGDYFKDQTTGQILGMRTDYRDATMEHLLDTYLSEDSEDGSVDEKTAEFERERAEIQTRYSDRSPEEAKKLREKDLKKLKMDLAGRQLRKILGETGKLKQIYRTRTNGTAINAKDWLRRWVNLDDEDALRREVNYYDEKMKEKNKNNDRRGADSNEDDGRHHIYNEDDREYLLSEMQNLKDKLMDEKPEVFFEDTKEQLEEWFGANTVVVKKYIKYFEKDNPRADNQELYLFLKDLLEDPDNYPDAP